MAHAPGPWSSWKPGSLHSESRNFLPGMSTNALQLELLQRPSLGDVIPGTGGLRKTRVALRGRGKRGGARIIYFWHPQTARLLMLYAYSKNEREDLTHAQREALRKIVETEYL
jgi:hypothetical protein